MAAREVSWRPIGLLAALLACGPGCGSGPEQASSGGGFAGLSDGDMALFRSTDPIGGPARGPADATAAFMEFDANGDGALDQSELPSQFQSLLARADADADGAASEEEILALLTREADESEEIAEAGETP